MNNSYNNTVENKYQSKRLVFAVISTSLALITLSAGCTAPRFRLYKGPLRPSDEIAIIKTSDEELKIIRADDEYLQFTKFQSLVYHTKWADVVEVEPGVRKLLILHDGLITKDEIWMTLDAQAGHIYEIRTFLEKLQTVYRIIDITTKETVLTKYGSS